MIFVFSIISVLLLLYIIYAFLKGQSKESAAYITFALFFMLFFCLIDYGLNISWLELDNMAQKQEVCTLSEISSDCIISYDYSQLTQEQLDILAIREVFISLQFQIFSLLSYVIPGAFMFLLSYTAYKQAKEMRLIQ